MGSEASAAGERLYVVVTGHVDHGKSTLVGRILADTGTVPDGKLEQVRALCERDGRPFEYAFLLDALKDERSQGITIDVARVFFKTAQRHYVIIDAPGHTEFLKNMVTGAARAQAALLVIDAAEGVRENSRRHGTLLSLLGIEQVAVVVNKMDLVNWKQSAFGAIETEYRAFLERLGVRPAVFIPTSGRTGAFVALNCAAMSPALAESELFGHVAGAFTGAARRTEGLFEAARGGTLFLDEIGEMALDLQPKLLRVLALGEVRAVGSATAQMIDVSIVAATNRDLDAEVAGGRFRADLLARLAGWRIHVPPLRTRRDDILPLVSLMLTPRGLGLSVDAAEALLLHDWPYNVRELEQVISGAATRATAAGGRVILAEHLPPPLARRIAGRATADGDSAPKVPAAGVVAQPEDCPSAEALIADLTQTGCNIAEVARRYGKQRRQIYRWIERLGIDLATIRGAG